ETEVRGGRGAGLAGRPEAPPGIRRTAGRPPGARHRRGGKRKAAQLHLDLRGRKTALGELRERRGTHLHRHRPSLPLRHRLIRSQPYSDGSELDECEVVVGVFFVSRGDGAEVLEFVEEALDEVSATIKKGTESR